MNHPPSDDTRRKLEEVRERIGRFQQRVALLDQKTADAVAAGRNSYPTEVALRTARAALSAAFAREEALLQHASGE